MRCGPGASRPLRLRHGSQCRGNRAAARRLAKAYPHVRAARSGGGLSRTPLAEIQQETSMQRRTFTLAATAAALAGFQPLVRAQAWPDKPVRLIVAQPAGSGPDSIAR